MRTVLVAAIMLAAIAAFYFLREHWDHAVGSWPYLLLLLCPVLHTLAHRRHGASSGHEH